MYNSLPITRTRLFLAVAFYLSNYHSNAIETTTPKQSYMLDRMFPHGYAQNENNLKTLCRDSQLLI